MNWEAAGAIGELIGSAAVLVTLVYLALQVRQNTQHVRAQMSHDGWLQNSSDHAAMMGDDHAGAFVRVALGQEAPTPEDLKVLDARFRSVLMHMGRVEHMSAQGLHIYSVEETAMAYAEVFNCNTGRAWLEANPAFVDAIAPRTTARIRELIDDPDCRSEAGSFASFYQAMTKRANERGAI